MSSLFFCLFMIWWEQKWLAKIFRKLREVNSNFQRDFLRKKTIPHFHFYDWIHFYSQPHKCEMKREHCLDHLHVFHDQDEHFFNHLIVFGLIVTWIWEFLDNFFRIILLWKLYGVWFTWGFLNISCTYSNFGFVFACASANVFIKTSLILPSAIKNTCIINCDIHLINLVNAVEKMSLKCSKHEIYVFGNGIMNTNIKINILLYLCNEE